MKILLIYDENIFSNNLEIFLYAVVYSFHFQYKTYNYNYIKYLLNDNELTLDNIIKNKFYNSPKVIKVFSLIGSILMKIYFWALVIFFIFFSCYFEINLLFGIKLILFFTLCYQFLTTIQQPKERKCVSKCINWIFLLYCCLNTFASYIFQLDFDFLKGIRQKEGFIYQNLPNIGFTFYDEKERYINFIAHFLSSFICSLYVYTIENILYDIESSLLKTKSKLILEKKTMKKN